MVSYPPFFEQISFELFKRNPILILSADLVNQIIDWSFFQCPEEVFQLFLGYFSVFVDIDEIKDFSEVGLCEQLASACHADQKLSEIYRARTVFVELLEEGLDLLLRNPTEELFELIFEDKAIFVGIDGMKVFSKLQLMRLVCLLQG